MERGRCQGSGRPTSIGAVYTTVERLAEKGYVRVRLSAPIAERGGRARKLARLTAAGHRATREAATALGRMLVAARLAPSAE